MKYVFIINPAAGKGEEASALEKELSGREGCEIYLTKGPMDAPRFIEERCRQEPEEQFCFVACGGDGTINEVATGVLNCPNAAMSVYACGSGNDFVKVFGGKERFNQIDAILAAQVSPIDVLRVNDRWCINVFNFGFDTCVAKTMAEVKMKPVIGGKNAYTTGIIKAICTAMKTECTVIVDGETLHQGDMLLCTIANGQYVGGAFKCAPRGDVTDGLIEVCLVKPISRLQFPKLLKPYTKGEHLDDPLFKDMILYRRGTKIEVLGKEGFAISLDGEIISGTRFEIEMHHNALPFALPKA